MQKNINLSTIGFTKKTAQEFFELLQKSKVKRIIDTRLKIFLNFQDLLKRKIYNISSKKLLILIIFIC